MAHLKEFSTPNHLRRNTRALVMRAPTTVTEGTTRRAKICGTTDIRGLAGFLLEPGRTFALHWAPPGCPRVARVDTWLTRAIAFSAIRARPTMLGIALAPAGTSGWVQRTTIRTLSHTLATRPVPGLHGRVLIHAAIAVLHSFLQHQCSIVVCREVHIGQELPHWYEGKAVGTAACLEIATLQPGLEILLRDFCPANSVLERRVATQGHTCGPQGFRGLTAVVTAGRVTAQVDPDIGTCSPTELQAQAAIHASVCHLRAGIHRTE